MSWLLVLPLALGVFGLAVWAFALERRLWTTLLAALTFGLAGYALQARSNLPASPRLTAGTELPDKWNTVEAREEMISARYASTSSRLLIADAMMRRGRFADAAVMARGAAQANPADGEAWLALANALVEHADGALTPAAIHAFRRAEAAAPQSAAPGYFLGLALIRQGDVLAAREIWQGAVAASAEDGEPHALLAERAARLDEVLRQAGAPPEMLERRPQSAP